MYRFILLLTNVSCCWTVPFRKKSKNAQKVTFKGTGTQDLIWLKVVSLDRSWLVGLTDDFKNLLSVALYFLVIF